MEYIKIHVCNLVGGAVTILQLSIYGHQKQDELWYTAAFSFCGSAYWLSIFNLYPIKVNSILLLHLHLHKEGF